MFALPDHTEEFPAVERRPALRELVCEGTGGPSLLVRVAVFCIAAALMLAAAGVWAAAAEDPAVRLIKLGASLGMLGASVVLLMAIGGGREHARVEIDPARDEIRTYEREMGGRVFLTGRFSLREMSEITLRDGTFMACAEGGRFSVTAPVRSRRQARAIRAALALV